MSEIAEVHQSEVVDSRWQTREDGYSGPKFDELVASIAWNGISSPPVGFINEAGQHELICGHRRMAAIRHVAIERVPFIVKVDLRELNEEAKQEWLDIFQQEVLADNMGHEDPTPVELARALQGLIQQQGLSQAMVGELYGKSQQWVSDLLALLDLTEPVQKALTARAVEKTVARALAKLPEEYQKPVLDYVKGKPSREAEKAISDIEKATDPGFWDLPEDEPVDAEHYNIKLMVDECLDHVPEGRMPEVLIKLRSVGDLVPPANRSPYWMTGFSKTCGTGDKTLDQWLIDHGRSCEDCVFQELGQHHGCSDEETLTCRLYMGPDDPVRLPPPATKECDECTQERGVAICEDLGCYIEQLKAKRDAEKEQRGEEDLDREIAAQERLRAFYDRQLQEDVDCEHWLAQACQHCKSFRGKDQRDQCGSERAAYIRTAFWRCGDTVVPWCDGYRIRDLTALPEIDQNCFDEIVLAWLDAMSPNIPWLPGTSEEGDLAAIKEAGLTKKQLIVLMTHAINIPIDDYSMAKLLINPVTGETETWKRIEEKEEEPTEEPG